MALPVCGEGTSLKDHLDRLNTILLDLRNIDIEIDDKDVVLILLASLPPSYENFRESLTNGKDSLSLEEVRSALHSRELLHTYSGPVSDTGCWNCSQHQSGKSDGFKHFQLWKTLVENQTGNKVKRSEFVEFCKIEGIARHHTVRNTPQQNGVAEHMNQTLLEMAFGCTVYYHVNEGKLEPMANKEIFIGYGDSVKGCKIWPPSERRVILSRNVVFDKNSMFSPIVKSTTSEEGGVENQVEQKETEASCEVKEDSPQSHSEAKSSVVPSSREHHSLALDRPRIANYGIPPTRDRSQKKLFLSQKGYIEKILSSFEMATSKAIDTPSASNANLSVAFAPKLSEEKEYMKRVHYTVTQSKFQHCLNLLNI
ncbi:hypothetical protein LIER_13705 [Lithospermum erythrorhizon]|uniref:Retroviral polymerase SH3-like domain-containing protein n=1 Tax=Lithospermum erythrorhizon TaxID=34254 RepID=A0AAV3Q1P3_LITER